MATKTIYVCEGTCHGMATEEQWKAGAKSCSAEGCNMHGMPLKKKKVKA
ncbi:MAG TPA: hypothetical protein PLO51_02655 [Candidatus Micrarchaeota archaeon]|nr:hypothetical protein [Candidatus Micrarchaeota archaeon]